MDHHELGVQFWVDNRINNQFTAPDVVDGDDAGKDRDPIGAGDEFEGGDHGVHFQHGLYLHAMRLEIGFEIAAANIVWARRDDLQRAAFGEAHGCQRRKTSART